MIADESAGAALVLSVREFTERLARFFARAPLLKHIGIKGQVSGLREFGNGHLGFSLLEKRASVDCIAWASHRRRFSTALKVGDSVIAFGAVSVDPESGGYRLYVESIESTGRGELMLLYERLKKKFDDEGLFDAARKRPIPTLLRRVALVSPRDGKGARDFMHTIESEVPFVEVVSIETRVQGKGAEIDIATALDKASRCDVEAIVLARGGGKGEQFEHFFPFNLEPVVRAIVRSRVPVITAIGHEPNHQLADAVADQYFDTPSKAAEFIAKGWLIARRRLVQGKRDVIRGVRDVVLRRARDLDARMGALERVWANITAGKLAEVNTLIARLERRNPQRTLAEQRARLVAGSARLDALAARRMSEKAHRWGESRNDLDRVATA
ncbi:MAG TPA: exodeoxyribonuclease VII large subunit, partial [Candidatus Tumulicola sp.]|nr:exodeoxyribonuclease VII large subunit [Candidatus Tumulicola sp.]